MTNATAAEQLPDRVEGRISASGLQLQRNSQLCDVCQEMFVSRAHQMHFSAGIHDHGQMLGLITCCEHIKLLTNQQTWQSVSSLVAWPESEDPTGDKTSLKIASYHVLTRSHCCSRGQEDQVVPFQMMTKSGVTSTQLSLRTQLCPTWWIRDFSTLFAPILSRCSFSCLCRCCRRGSNLNLCERICTCLLEHKCPWRSVHRESLRCMRLCDHLWHPFPPQPRCR